MFLRMTLKFNLTLLRHYYYFKKENLFKVHYSTSDNSTLSTCFQKVSFNSNPSDKKQNINLVILRNKAYTCKIIKIYI